MFYFPAPALSRAFIFLQRCKISFCLAIWSVRGVKYPFYQHFIKVLERSVPHPIKRYILHVIIHLYSNTVLHPSQMALLVAKKKNLRMVQISKKIIQISWAQNFFDWKLTRLWHLISFADFLPQCHASRETSRRICPTGIRSRQP